jgi:hypothetical protein
MKTIKNFFKNILSESSSVSSKRFIALAGFMFLAITMLINSFSDINKAPADALVSAVELITMVAIGGVTAEKFSTKRVNDKLTDQE